jgi:hypothetical protein
MTRNFILFIILVILIVGCTSKPLEYEYELERTEVHEWAVDSIIQINVSTENGSINISPVQDTLITAEITKRCFGEDSIDAEERIDSILINETITTLQLTLEAEMPDNGERNYQADFDITTPESLYINLSTANGTITVTDMVLGARIRIVNGEIVTQNLKGGIAGVIVNGTIDCDLALLDAGKSAILSAMNGEVILSLPSNVSAMFDILVANGQIAINGFSSITYTINDANHKAGTFGTGDATITIAVMNGSVNIQAR